MCLRRDQPTCAGEATVSLLTSLLSPAPLANFPCNSGCVTSAETVLVDAQNHKEFLAALKRRPPAAAAAAGATPGRVDEGNAVLGTASDGNAAAAMDLGVDVPALAASGGGGDATPDAASKSAGQHGDDSDDTDDDAPPTPPPPLLGDRLVVVSLSPQSTASIAARHHLSMEDAAQKLTTFLKGLGVHKVYDTSFGRASQHHGPALAPTFGHIREHAASLTSGAQLFVRSRGVSFWFWAVMFC